MTVYLVGAGPGDPGLLTVRGAEVLRGADVVVYDRLSVAELLDLAPPHAERISVGKRPGRASARQEDINALLVERGAKGQQVVRLKGGDPFVFARGGEEAQALLDAGVPFEIVPGVTSAVAVPAYAGVPVTHRGLSTSFTVVTGHEDPWAATDTDWEAVAKVGGTIVVLMGAATRGAIADRLVAGGLAGDTPVTAVTWGTGPDQRTVRTTLAGLRAAPVEAPATIVIGAVAGLDLAWFEHRRLFGRRVVVARTPEQAGPLVSALRDAGARVVTVPAIAIADPDDGGAALRRAATSAGSYDWVVFTSPNAVARFFACVTDARALAGARVAAIGPATAGALHGRGVVADLVASRAVSEWLRDSFPDPPPAGGRVLLPRAAVARDVLPQGLEERGWRVDVIEAYRTVAAPVAEGAVQDVERADAVVFTSGSTVEHLTDAVGADRLPPVIVAIGPVTAAAAEQRGLRVHAVADEPVPGAIVDALAGAFAAAADPMPTDGR